MSFLEIFVIGIGLSMDAFAVSIGMSSILSFWRERFFLSFLFGFFQFLMILFGYYFGSLFPFVSSVKNIFSFVLLFYVGVHMIIESFSSNPYPSFSIISAIFLAIATSVDAFCVGFSFSFYLERVFLISCFIGFITLTLSILGNFLGKLSRKFFHHYSEIFGGILLILLSIHFLLERL